MHPEQCRRENSRAGTAELTSRFGKRISRELPVRRLELILFDACEMIQADICAAMRRPSESSLAKIDQVNAVKPLDCFRNAKEFTDIACC
jgi:hypothetical protein